MKQLLQDLKSGKTQLVEEPRPRLKGVHVLVETCPSLISAGTERMLVEFGKAGYLAKAKSQPDKVRQVLEKIKTDGLVPTIKAVRAKLDQPLPLRDISQKGRENKGQHRTLNVTLQVITYLRGISLFFQRMQ